MMIQSAIIYSVSMGIVALFQLCLAMGAPWGVAAMGGRFPGKYPPKMRIVAGINIFVLGILTMIVLIKAGIILSQMQHIAKIAIWIVVVFSFISVIMNTITPSKIEKIWIPVTIIHLITSIIVAIH